MKRISFLLAAMLMVGSLYGQITITEEDTPGEDTPGDTLKAPAEFTIPAAREYIQRVVEKPEAWNSQDDPVKDALERLLDHSVEPFDSARSTLLLQDFRTIGVRPGNPVLTRRIALKWLNDSTFLVDPQGWSPSLYLKKETRLVYPAVVPRMPSDSLPYSVSQDSSLLAPDTLQITVLDTAALNALGISLHHYTGQRVTPPLARDADGSMPYLSNDRSAVLYYSAQRTWEAEEGSPFRRVDGQFQLDSLQYAMNTLLAYTEERDSTRILINDMRGRRVPFWLGTGSEEAYRFWVKNYNNDSVTIWLGNPGSGELSMLLEDDISFNRLVKEEFEHLPRFVAQPELSLKPMEMLETEPRYWDLGFNSAFVLNQTYLSNWTKGGESSLSTMMDLQAGATYNNKEAKTQWINTVRLKYGTITTKEKGTRKNHDELEINSKFNSNAWGKIGMSASLYMKHQLAKGYNYPNDSVPISKFLNPGTMTVGLGFEYKPAKEISFNVAPLSYKTTFVLDTALIDQTLHGIAADQRAKREMGTQVVVHSKITPFKSMEVTNNLRLFSNYLNKPQNVDVDWELLIDQKINWFFSIRLNFHLIYDDDVRFPVLDENNQPVILPDGSEKKVADLQFKEFIGLSLQFKF